MWVVCVVTLQKSQNRLLCGQFLLRWPLSPQWEHVIVVEGWVAAFAFVNAFFDLVAPGPLPLVGALVDPLVSLCSGGSCLFVLGLETGGACDGLPAHVVGAAGVDPCGLIPVALEGWPWALFSLSIAGPLRMVHSLLPSSDDNCCCVALLSVLGGMNLPWMFLLVMDSSGLYKVSPLGLWWASLRSAGSLCGCGVHFSWGVDVRALLFIPQSAGVWGLSMSKVMGLILLKLNPMSFSSKDLKCENDPVLLACGCLLSPCIITCISLVMVLTSWHAVCEIWSAFLCSRSLLLGR